MTVTLASLRIAVDSTDVSRAQQALAGMTGAAGTAGRGADTLARHQEVLMRALQGTNTTAQANNETLRRYQDEVRRANEAVREAVRAQDELADESRRVREEMDKTSGAANGLYGILGLLGIGLGMGALASMTDQYTALTSQVKLAAQSKTEFVLIMDEVSRIARTTQTSLGDTATLFARVKKSTEEMGVPIGQVTRMTETMALSMKVSGASADETANALRQLSQGLAAGALRGDEFNAVSEQGPRLMQALAEGMGKTVGELRKLASEGKLTTNVLAEALPRSLEKLREEAKQVQTISGAFQVLTDSVMVFVGTQAQASEVVRHVTEAFAFLAEHIDLVAIAVVGLTSAKLATWAAGWVASSMAAARAAMGQAAAANMVAVAEANAAVATTRARLAQAQASTASAASEMQRANAQVALIRSTIATAGADTRLATEMQLKLIPALDRAAAAELRLAGAQAEQVIAGNAATLAAGRQTVANNALAASSTLAARAGAVMSGVMAAMGGPIGLVITALTVGAIAWTAWGQAAEDGNKKALDSMRETSEEFLERLEKQNAKLRERLELMGKVPELKQGGMKPADAEGLAELEAKYQRTRTKTGEYAGMTDDQAFKAGLLLLRQQARARAAIKDNLAKEEQIADKKRDETLSEWRKKNGTANQRRDAEIEEQTKAFGGKLPEEVRASIFEKYRDKKLDNKLESQLEREKKQFDTWTAGLREKTKTMELELATGKRMTDSQKAQLYLDEQLEKGKVKRNSKEHLFAQADVLGLRDIERRKDEAAVEEQVAEAIKKSSTARKEAAAVAAIENATGMSREQREMAKIALEGETWATNELTRAREKGAVTAKQEADIRVEAAARVKQAQDAYQAGEAKDNRAAELTRELRDAAQAAYDFADAMAEAFGRAGEAVGGVVAALANYGVEQDNINKKRDEAIKYAADSAAVEKAQATARQESAQLQMRSYGDMAASAKGFFKEGTAGYRALQGAEKAFRLFELAMSAQAMITKMAHTKAFSSLFVTSKAQETAATVASVGPDVAASMAKGQAAAAAGVANQAQGDPYSAWARMAAMAAAMAALGFMVAGGSSKPSEASAAVVQEKQGTGSVLGDSKARSMSITRALDHLGDNSDLMLPLTAQMAQSLRNIEAGIGGIGNLAVRGGVNNASSMNNLGKLGNVGQGVQNAASLIGAGGGALMGGAVAGAMTIATIGTVGKTLGAAIAGPVGMVLGAIAGALLGKIIGGKEKSVTDAGLMIGGSVGSLQAGQGVQQYANVHTEYSGIRGWFQKDKDEVKTQAASAEVSQQFALVFTALDQTLTAAASALGRDGAAVSQAIDQVVIATEKISLKDLTGDELAEAITTVLSKAMDDVARAAMPGLEAFQQIGEGYAETVVRVATGVEQAGVYLKKFGIAMTEWTAIGNKQGDVGAELVRESVLVVEKVNGALTGVGEIVKNLGGTVDDLAQVYGALLDVRKMMTAVKLNGQDLGQDLISGAGGLQNLQGGLSAYLEGYFSPAEQSAAELAELRKEFDKLGKTMPTTKAGLRAMIEATGTATPEAAALTGSLLALAEAFAQAMDNADALTGTTDRQGKAVSNLQAAYNKASGELNAAINRLSSFQTQLTNFGKSLLLANESPLTPEQKYAEAKRQYQDTVTRAKAGDEQAQSQFTSVAQAFLAASRTVNASDQVYQADYFGVVAMTKELNIAATSQIDVAKEQLVMLKESVRGILDVEDAVLSVADAIRELAVVMAELAGATPEQARANTAAVTGLYQSGLGRAPDAGGLSYWVEQMAKGMSYATVKEGIYGSAEAQAKAPITNLYQSILGRAPDTEGLNYWTRMYQSGITLEQIAAAMKGSSEGQRIDGSHYSGLERVPFDGYMAELHRDETVMDADASAALRRYFGGTGGGGESSAALVAEVRALREETSRLRAENAEQAEMVARVLAATVDKNGDKVASAVNKGQQGAAWAQQQAKRGVLA